MRTEIKMNFSPIIAKDVGTNAAIIFSNIKFWISTNERNKSKPHYHDEKYWMYNSNTAFIGFFPYLTEGQIRRCLSKLEEKGYIITANYNKNKYDRTKWYALNDGSIPRKQQMDPSVPTDRADDSNQPIPNNKPNNKPNYLCPASQNGDDVEPTQTVAVNCLEKPVPDSKLTVDSTTSTKIPLKPLEVKPGEYYSQFVSRFNELFGRSFRKTTNMVAKLQTRMKSYTFEEIMEALEKLGSWEWAHGDNDGGWQANPDFLLRNDAQIDRFLNMATPKIKKEFVKPDRRLAVEIVVMACLTTGVWDDSVKAIYGQELLPWMQKENIFPDFEKTVDLLVKFIQNKIPKLEVSPLSWAIVLTTFERYLKTCEELEIIPRPEIVEKGKQVRNEH